MNKNNNKNTFYIRHFDDYHEIVSKTHKYLELGCFFIEEYGYCRYFGLFFKGKKPSLSRVMNSLKKKVTIKNEKENSYCSHYFSGKDVGHTYEELIHEVKESLKIQEEQPYAYDD